MRLDGGKLKEIQVRLFLSSRAEMQEVIEKARQTTMSLMQMQMNAPPQSVAVLTPQSPPQVNQIGSSVIPAIPPVPLQIPGLLTHQMYQQLNPNAVKPNETAMDIASTRARGRQTNSRSYSRSKSRSRSRSRSPSYRYRYGIYFFLSWNFSN